MNKTVLVLSGVIFLTAAAGKAFGDEAYPTAYYGDFDFEYKAAQGPGYSFYQKSSTCAEGAEYEAVSEWYDFESLRPSVGAKFRYLYVKWKDHYVAGRGIISNYIEYSVDGGSSWRTLVANTYSSGLSTSSWQETITVLPPILRGGHNPYDLSSVRVRAGLIIIEDCPGTIGSYGGGLYLKEIKILDERP